MARRNSLGALASSAGLRDQSDLARTTRCVLQWQLGKLALGMAAAAKRIPTGPTLRKGRVKLDMACMLHMREDPSAAVAFRYLACDASPQKLEIFASVERLVQRSSLAHMNMQQWPAELPNVVERRLPMLSL